MTSYFPYVTTNRSKVSDNCIVYCTVVGLSSKSCQRRIKLMVLSLKMSIIPNIEERHVERGAMAELMLMALRMPQQQ